MAKHLIVGLGNPGQDYAMTRHNLGWLAVEALARRSQGVFRQDKTLHALLADVRINDTSAVLCLPTTFMNESGQAVQGAAQYFKIPTEQILLVQDELDFPFGTFAFRAGGTAGGHNGVASVYERMGNVQLARLRIGIGRPTGQTPTKDYVLERLDEKDREALPLLLQQVSDAIEVWATKGLTTAMNSWNGVKYDPSTGAPTMGSDRVL